MDDDVMDQQKWVVVVVVFVIVFVDKEEEMEEMYDFVKGYILFSYFFYIVQEIMMRVDFVRVLDRLNLFSIMSKVEVRVSSVLMYIVFREIVVQFGFREYLQVIIDWIVVIESLGCMREIVVKDLVWGGKYEIKKSYGGVEVLLKQEGKKRDVIVVEEEDDDDDGKSDDQIGGVILRRGWGLVYISINWSIIFGG